MGYDQKLLNYSVTQVENMKNCFGERLCDFGQIELRLGTHWEHDHALPKKAIPFCKNQNLKKKDNTDEYTEKIRTCRHI